MCTSVFMFYFIGIDESGVVNCVLCSVYDKRLIDATIFQLHWSGRATRGVAQFNGRTLSNIIRSEDFNHDINSAECISFLEGLLQR